MTHNLYTTRHHGIPNHIRLFLQTDPTTGSGTIYHVVGTVLMGMTLEIRAAAPRPDADATFIPGTQALVGRVRVQDVARFEAVARAVPPPGSQVGLNGKPKDPSRPVRRCGEWVDEVRERGVAEGVIVEVV